MFVYTPRHIECKAAVHERPCRQPQSPIDQVIFKKEILLKTPFLRVKVFLSTKKQLKEG